MSNDRGVNEVSEEKVKDRPKHFKAYAMMLFSSLLSLGASLVLATDAITLAKNASAKLSCDVNAVVSCGKVALSWQSNLLGFPNSFLGLICEPVVITVAIAGLMRISFPKRFIQVALTVYGIGLLFAFWLFSQSFFVIKAFCPWCLLVTFSTVTVFFSMLRVALLDGAIPLRPSVKDKITRALSLNRDSVVVVFIYSLLALAVIFKYGKYFLP